MKFQWYLLFFYLLLDFTITSAYLESAVWCWWTLVPIHTDPQVQHQAAGILANFGYLHIEQISLIIPAKAGLWLEFNASTPPSSLSGPVKGVSVHHLHRNRPARIIIWETPCTACVIIIIFLNTAQHLFHTGIISRKLIHALKRCFHMQIAFVKLRQFVTNCLLVFYHS